MLQFYVPEVLEVEQVRKTSKNSLNLKDNSHDYYMGPEASKPVLGVCKQQRCRPACADCSESLLFSFWKVSYLNLLQVKFQCPS